MSPAGTLKAFIFSLVAPKPSSTYRPDIDGLRAIAILSVVFNHAGFAGFSGGFVGVDVFFVISGYLITALLFNELSVTGHLSLSAFYARRVRRLMPASTIVVGTTLVLGAFFMPQGFDEQGALAKSAKALTYFWSNFYFFKHTGGYFDAPSYSLPLLHTWSLSVEEQYYLVWPLLTLLIFRFLGGANEAVARRRVILTLGVMLVASFLLCVATTAEQQSFAFFLLPSRVWEFAAGGIIGLLGRGFYTRLAKGGDLLAATGLALVVYAIVALDHHAVFPGWVALLPVAGSVLLIVGMTANDQGLVRRLMACRPMVAIGLLSYSWYLWHWPLLSLYRVYNLGDQNVLANGLLLLLALFLAWLTYIWVERPIRLHRPWVFSRVRSTLVMGVVLSLAVFAMASGLRSWNKHQRSDPNFLAYHQARDDIPPYSKGCALPGDKPVTELRQRECVHGPGAEKPRVLLWGDSHADHMMPMVMAALPDQSVFQLTMPGCVPVSGYEGLGPVSPRYCQAFNQRVLAAIPELQRRGLTGVVISARWPSYLWQPAISRSEQKADEAPVDTVKVRQARADFQAGLERTLSALDRTGVRVIVLAPTPELVYPAPQCLSLGRGSYCDVDRSLNDTLLADATAALEEVVARHPKARLIDATDFFCDTATCYAARGGDVLYFDDDHLSATGARRLGEYLHGEMTWLLGRAVPRGRAGETRVAPGGDSGS